jgi:hypothetical protein
MKEVWKAFMQSMVRLAVKLGSTKFIIWIILTVIATAIILILKQSFNDWSMFEIGITTLLFAANQSQKIIESKERINAANNKSAERVSEK